MRRSGFTLIELSVTLAVVALVMGAAVMGIGALTGAKAKESTTQLAGVIRVLYDTAALTGKTCRLVFELPGERDEDGEVSYHAECAAQALTASKNREDELREVAEKSKRKDKLNDDDHRFRRRSADDAPSMQDLMEREKKRVDGFAKYSELTTEEISPKTLPKSVSVSVWTRQQHKLIKNGPVYLYFFPQGFTERAQIYIKQGSNVWTLSVSSLTGKTTVVGEELEVPSS